MQTSNFYFSNALNSEFWNRKLDSLPPDLLLAARLQAQEAVTLFKVGRILSKTVQRRFLVLEQHLFYFNENANLKGAAHLHNAYLKKRSRDPTPDMPFPFHLILRKDQSLIYLYFYPSQPISDFLDRLEASCILEDFEASCKIVRQLGEGSTAKVFLTESLKDQQLYAAKIIPKDLRTPRHKDTKANALNEEIKIMRSLDHPNLAKLHRVYETESNNPRSVQMVMSLFEGGLLLEKTSHMTLPEKQSISKELLLTVSYLHQQGIMHRDLKPQNILYKHKDPKNHEFVIIDFGFATRIKQQSHVLYKCGTPGYVAPEILEYREKGRMYNEQCDVFSLGVILYEMYSSLRPSFYARNPFKVQSKNETLRLNQVAQLTFDDRVEVPQSLKNLLISMLRRDPKDRFSIQQCLEQDFFKETLPPLRARCQTEGAKFQAQQNLLFFSGNSDIDQESPIQQHKRVSMQRASVGSTNDPKLHRKYSQFQERPKQVTPIQDQLLKELNFAEKHQIPKSFGQLMLGTKS